VITWVLSSIEALKSGHLPSGALLRLPVWKTTSDPVHDLSIEQVSHKPSTELPLRMKIVGIRGRKAYSYLSTPHTCTDNFWYPGVNRTVQIGPDLLNSGIIRYPTTGHREPVIWCVGPPRLLRLT
jgi:hypothetical protein